MEWINIEDKTPEDGIDCLVAFKCCESFVFDLATYYDSDEGFLSLKELKLYKSVTHWMPLPAPPKEN